MKEKKRNRRKKLQEEDQEWRFENEWEKTLPNGELVERRDENIDPLVCASPEKITPIKPVAFRIGVHFSYVISHKVLGGIMDKPYYEMVKSIQKRGNGRVSAFVNIISSEVKWREYGFARRV